MVCNKCYYNNDDNSMICTNCGEPLQSNSTTQQQPINGVNTNSQPQYNSAINVPTYSVANAVIALIVCLSCCSNIAGVVFAILSLVEGSKVSQYVRYGDMQAANASLEQAKKWVKYAWISLAIWAAVIVIFYVVYFVFIFGLAVVSEM